MIIIELINYVKSDFIDIVDIYRKILSSKIYTEGNISKIKTHLLAVSSYTIKMSGYGYCDTKSDIIKKIFDIGVNTINIIENIKETKDAFIRKTDEILITDLKKIDELLQIAKKKGFTDAFIVSFSANGKRNVQ